MKKVTVAWVALPEAAAMAAVVMDMGKRAARLVVTMDTRERVVDA